MRGYWAPTFLSYLSLCDRCPTGAAAAHDCVLQRLLTASGQQEEAALCKLESPPLHTEINQMRRQVNTFFSKWATILAQVRCSFARTAYHWISIQLFYSGQHSIVTVLYS